MSDPSPASDDPTVEAPPVEFEEAPCPMGCPPGAREVLVGTDRLHGRPGTFRIVRCRHCGLMRTNPRPTPETIGWFYPPEYGPFAAPVSPRPASALRDRARELLGSNATRLPSLPPGRMLEIGCATGNFLAEQAARGWAVEGIEPDPDAAHVARERGFDVQTGQLETATPPEEPYGLVVGWMVLEHLHQPIACLEKLHAWTRPGGWLAISVPNAAALEFRLFRTRWYALQLPTHLFHYTPTTIENVLAAGGWDMERLFHQRALNNFFASAGYLLDDLGAPSGVTRWFLDYPADVGPLQRATIRAAEIAAAAAGQTGRMTVWARRRDD